MKRLERNVMTAIVAAAVAASVSGCAGILNQTLYGPPSAVESEETEISVGRTELIYGPPSAFDSGEVRRTAKTETETEDIELDVPQDVYGPPQA